MAKTNFQYEKRQKDLEKKRKKEEKVKKKADKGTQPSVDVDGNQVEVDAADDVGIVSAEAPADLDSGDNKA